jgi:hypothetical protein
VPAHAHGFGQRYDLPLPLPLYLLGAAAVVALSFAVFGLFVRRAPAVHAYPHVDLLATRLGRLIARPWVVMLIRLIGVVLFAVTILAGLIGDPNPYRNIAPTMVWIIWWVGLVYVSAFVGDVWALLNPWRTIFDAAFVVMARERGRATLGARASSTPQPSRAGTKVPHPNTGVTGSPAFAGDDKPGGTTTPPERSPIAYPPWLGVWPACALLLGFAWIELVYPNAAAPAHLAWLAIAYSLLTWTGMAVFGRDAWLERGEVFTVVFGLFARFAPTEFRSRPPQLLLRPFGAGLIDATPVPTSLMAFVLLLLATVLYDGFSATPVWSQLEQTLAAAHFPLGTNAAPLIRTAGLVAFWLVFLGVYLHVCLAMSFVAGGSALDIARSFALTLIPIAIGYHLAHYLVFLLVQGQYIIPLLSDPFGFGWNLFGTAGYRVDIAIVGARFAWYAALAAIVLGHVAAVYLGHVRAIQTFGAPAAALRSQVPLTALMVVYTFTGLSIIAGPIVEQTTPAQPTASASRTVDVPPDAVLPEQSGALRPIGPDKLAGAKLTYRMLGSAFHDGTRVTAADLLYGYMFAYRWGTDGERYDPVVAAATEDLRQHLVALRFVGTDAGTRSFRVGDVDFVRELLTVEVYLSLAPDDPEQDAVVAPPWSTLPWHLLVVMEEAVSRGWAAFSQGEAKRRGTEWLDLVRSENLKSRLAALVATFERDGYRPDALRSLVSVDEARKRWSALAAFHKSHGHFLVTNGPYRLKQWSETAATLEAFRDLTYPLGVGSYDAYAIPRRGFVTKADASGTKVTLSGEIEIVQKFQRSYRLVRTPLQSIGTDALRRADPQCRYLILDESGRVIFAGQQSPADDASFRIDLAGRLPPGRYTMQALIAPNGNAMNAEIRRIPIVIPP